jgi:hypothetical protein
MIRCFIPFFFFISTRASLVPVFSFGETDVYTQIDNPEGSWLRWVQEKIRKRIGLAPPLFHGRGIFQYSFGILPFRKPISVVGTFVRWHQKA